MSIRHLAIASLLVAGSAAQAQVIFTDNFNADRLGLNKTTFVGGWTVGNGSVDVIGAGPAFEPGAGPGQSGNATNYNYLPGNGNYIDLDGSSSDAGMFSKSLTLTAGTTYVASFQLAGSQRNFTESVTATFGTASTGFTYTQLTPFTTSTLTFTPTTTGSYLLWFGEPGTGGNNEGLLLDNVSVTAVPEPSTYALMLAGIGAVGFLARRRDRA